MALFGCFIGEGLAACGAVKVLEEEGGRYGEIKRLFVAAQYRGRSISAALMERLEQHLADVGAVSARLDVGVSRPEALSLYRKRGYVERGPFGAYRYDPLSLFLEKRLARK